VQTRLGRFALHGAFLTSAPGRAIASVAFLPPRASVPLASDAPVASFSAPLESLSANSALPPRPPRSIPRLPREEQSHSRSGASSIGQSLLRTPRPPWRKRGRVTFNRSRQRSRDEDSLRSAEPPPFCRWLPLRSRAWARSSGQAPVHALRTGVQAFDLDRYRDGALL